MGFMDSIKEALGGDRDDLADSETTDAGPRHVDREAPAETSRDVGTVTGGKHALRD